MKRIFIYSSLILVSACNKPDPKPELRDPIYQQNVSDAQAAEKAVVDAEKELEDKIKAVESSEINTLDKKIARSELLTAKATYAKLKQKAEYLKLKVISRQREARESYLKAFRKHEEWPNPAEFAEYEANQRLKSVSLRWSDRIPSSRDAPAKEEKKSESAPSSGGH